MTKKSYSAEHTFIDKYGKAHPTPEMANFADRCYDMMRFLSEDMNIGVLDAERIVGQMMEDRRVVEKFFHFAKACFSNQAIKKEMLVAKNISQKD